MLNNLGEDVKKLLLAGIGAAAVTAEKGKDAVDELVRRGELTVEQGKILNEELKHNLKEKLSPKKDKVEEVSKTLESLSQEDLAALKEKIESLQTAGEKDGEE